MRYIIVIEDGEIYKTDDLTTGDSDAIDDGRITVIDTQNLDNVPVWQGVE